MMPITATALTAPPDSGRDTTGRTDGEGFLDTLLLSLPPEAQGLSLQEMLDWLRQQSEGALAGLVPPLPQTADIAMLPDLATPGGGIGSDSESDPTALIGLIMSSRENLAAGAEEALGAPPIGALEDSQQPVAEDAFQRLLQAAPETGEGTHVAGELDAREAEAQAAAKADAPLRVPVRHPEFGQAVGERMLWMVRNETQEAKIRLDPPSLGPLEISVSVKDDQASIVIHAQHALTREALEAEVPRLRSMLSEQGFAQAEVDIARDDAGRDGERQHAGGNTQRRAEPEAVEEMPVGGMAAKPKLGLIDQYI
jgi:flagellar hook-length control protein FliK